jgi:chemotaxis receptor (MCP) glutamine deamidase CheD
MDVTRIAVSKEDRHISAPSLTDGVISCVVVCWLSPLPKVGGMQAFFQPLEFFSP